MAYVRTQHPNAVYTPEGRRWMVACEPKPLHPVAVPAQRCRFNRWSDLPLFSAWPVRFFAMPRRLPARGHWGVERVGSFAQFNRAAGPSGQALRRWPLDPAKPLTVSTLPARNECSLPELRFYRFAALGPIWVRSYISPILYYTKG